MTQAEIDKVLQGFIDEIFHKCETPEDYQDVDRRLMQFYRDNHLKDEQMELFFNSNAGEILGFWLPQSETPDLENV